MHEGMRCTDERALSMVMTPPLMNFAFSENENNMHSATSAEVPKLPGGV